MAAPVKRPWDGYPRSYFFEAQRIAVLAVPTLQDSFDPPPLCGPYKGRRDVNIFRAQWHRFLESLHEATGVSGTAPHHARLYYILADLTSRSDPRLRDDGTEEWYLEFAPHPIILSSWRNSLELFESAKNRHSLFLKSIDSGDNAS